jgi:hypothetical protein
MARKKTTEGGESDLIERGDEQGETNAGLGMVDHSRDFDGSDGGPLPHEDAAEDAQSAANLVGQVDRTAIKRANFSRLASKRVQRILVGLAVLKNLANTSTYDWNIGQQEKIFEAIDDQLTDVREAFEAAKKPKASKAALTFEV